MVQTFREITLWKRSMQLTLSVYRLSQEFPRAEQFGLTSQLRRAAVSIPSNLAEGQGRTSKGDFRQFLGIARGSNCEVQTQLEIARALNFGRPGMIVEAEALSEEVRKMLFGLLKSLKPSTTKN